MASRELLLRPLLSATCTLAQLARFQLDAPSPRGLLINSTWISEQQTQVLSPQLCPELPLGHE